MSIVMEEEIKRWTARRKSALVLEIIQGKTSVSEASRQFDLTPSEIESWVEDGKRGMENVLRAKPEDVREQYERQLKELQEAYGEALPAAERHGRTRHPDAERAVRAPAPLREPAACDAGDRRLDRVLQPPAPAPGAKHEDTRRGLRF
jgi:transposase-like protein